MNRTELWMHCTYTDVPSPLPALFQMQWCHQPLYLNCYWEGRSLSERVWLWWTASGLPGPNGRKKRITLVHGETFKRSPIIPYCLKVLHDVTSSHAYLHVYTVHTVYRHVHHALCAHVSALAHVHMYVQVIKNRNLVRSIGWCVVQLCCWEWQSRLHQLRSERDTCCSMWLQRCMWLQRFYYRAIVWSRRGEGALNRRVSDTPQARDMHWEIQLARQMTSNDTCKCATNHYSTCAWIDTCVEHFNCQGKGKNGTQL